MKPASAERISMPKELRAPLSRPWTVFRAHLVRGPATYTINYLRSVSSLHILGIVGDIVCSNVLSLWGTPRICIVDSRTMRMGEAQVDESLFESIDRCVNERSTISLECVRKMVELIELQQPSLLVVDGEEDLLALPLVAMNVLDVAFGIPRIGICVVPLGVDNSVKAINYLSRFVGFEKLAKASLYRNTQVVTASRAKP